MNFRNGLMQKVWGFLLGGFVLLCLLTWGFLSLQRDAQGELENAAKSAIQANARAALEQRANDLSIMLSESLANPLYFHDLNQLGEHIRMVKNQPEVNSVVVFDRDGHLVHDGTRDISSYGRPTKSEGEDLGKSRLVWKEDVLQASRPILIGEEAIGGVTVEIKLARTQALVAATHRQFSQSAASIGTRLAQYLWLPLLGLLALAGILAWLVAKGLVAPVRRLARATKRIEEQDYSVRFNSKRHDELGDLMRGFDRMSQSIASHEREIRRMAYSDGLTGMHNRAFLDEALQRSIDSAAEANHQMALLFVDLDDFKRINDTLGHRFGDLTLNEMAQRLSHCMDDIALRHPELDRDLPLISRFGGDEFVALVASADARSVARELAEMMLNAIRYPIDLEGQILHLAGSVGITVFPEDGKASIELLKNGDIAMYQAKQHGKNCYRFYNDQMTRRAEDRLALEQDLRVAIASSHIHLAYQPITDLRTGEILGAEALARWNHPQRGMVAPQEFIPLAEDMGMIDELGMQVLTEACAAGASWGSVSGHGPFISVNVSARQLRQAKFPLLLARILHNSGLSASQLHIELTESTLLDAAPMTLAILSDLHQMGIKLWLDDFGTGFSGLSHLRKVPVDGLKIDKSFIADLPQDHYDLALTSAVIAMARSLNISAVAEGIETKAQYDVLRAMRCDMGQGFALSEPVTADEMRVLIRSARCLDVAA